MYITNNKAKVAVVLANKDVMDDNTEFAAVQCDICVPTRNVVSDLGGISSLLCLAVAAAAAPT